MSAAFGHRTCFEAAAVLSLGAGETTAIGPKRERHEGEHRIANLGRGLTSSELYAPVMRARLRHDLTAALKSRDPVAVAALRSALAAIDNAEAVSVDSTSVPAPTSEHIAGATSGAGSSDVERRVLSTADVRAIVRTEIDQRIDAAAEYARVGRADTAEKLRLEAAVLSAYLLENW